MVLSGGAKKKSSIRGMEIGRDNLYMIKYHSIIMRKKNSQSTTENWNRLTEDLWSFL